ncbi:type II toxin-antitoxin system VapC family toxin [Afifella sp. IM 167]|uniref:type II toxin-antitoxin system VapC family toxin n=1 Tax=Afifella sp. IM 167 TaxID=2033586 RepID=UPI001CC9E277|nr:type II toxin-antitoxin system VapC family toxin [Afifella sp. IM 167]MBZ8135369.1 DNA-binding protein [Afifella sp. IM 167]
MSDTLVDTNVLIDVLYEDHDWAGWSQAQLRERRRRGGLVINPVIYAEVSCGFSSQRQADRAMSSAIYRREALPFDAAFAAGQAFLSYRQAGGARRSPLPDFYIGAHADFGGYFLLTRDPKRYRQYFPLLRIIAPDTHP